MSLSTKRNKVNRLFCNHWFSDCYDSLPFSTGNKLTFQSLNLRFHRHYCFKWWNAKLKGCSRQRFNKQLHPNKTAEAEARLSIHLVTCRSPFLHQVSLPVHRERQHTSSCPAKMCRNGQRDISGYRHCLSAVLRPPTHQTALSSMTIAAEGK